MDSNISFTNFVTKGIETEEINERRIVKGHITAEVVDRQDEFMAIEEVLAVIKNYMEVNPVISDYHSNRMVGIVKSFKKSEIEGHPSVYIEGEIYKKDGVTLYDHVWENVVKKEYKGFSIGGGSKIREPVIKNGKLVMNLKNLEIYEIALCPMPANPFAVIDYVNEFAKASDLGIKYNEDGRQRIQCSGIICEVQKNNMESDSSAYGDSQQDNPNKTKKFEDGIKKDYTLNLKIDDSSIEKLRKAIDSDVDVDVDHTGSDKELKEVKKEEDSISIKKLRKVADESQEIINFINTKTFIKGVNMTENKPDEIKKEDITPVAKDYSSEISLLTTISKQNVEGISTLSKGIDELRNEIKKQSVAGSGSSGSENPVETGNQAENKPKVTDNDDVGDKAKDGVYAPKGDAQASIVNPAAAPQKPDDAGTSEKKEGSDVKKSDEEKKEEKKEDEKKPDEVKKTDEDKKEDKKPEEVKKSDNEFQYEIVKAVRPKYNALPGTPEKAPTAYQVLKAIDNGWGGKHTNYEQSFIEAYQRLLKGEFGSGVGGGQI